MQILTEEFASVLLKPISNKTCDGFGEDDVHAEPDERAILGKDVTID